LLDSLPLCSCQGPLESLPTIRSHTQKNSGPDPKDPSKRGILEIRLSEESCFGRPSQPEREEC